MKNLEVKNIADLAAVPFNQSTEFKIKPLIAQADVKQCAANVVEVEPQGQAYSYHYHELNEELFFVLSGTGVVHTAQGDLPVRAGDVITLPPGPAGAHVMRNTSASEELVYLDFDTNNPAEIVHFPELKKILAIGPLSMGMYDEN